MNNYNIVSKPNLRSGSTKYNGMGINQLRKILKERQEAGQNIKPHMAGNFK